MNKRIGCGLFQCFCPSPPETTHEPRFTCTVLWTGDYVRSSCIKGSTLTWARSINGKVCWAGEVWINVSRTSGSVFSPTCFSSSETEAHVSKEVYLVVLFTGCVENTRFYGRTAERFWNRRTRVWWVISLYNNLTGTSCVKQSAWWENEIQQVHLVFHGCLCHQRPHPTPTHYPLRAEGRYVGPVPAGPGRKNRGCPGGVQASGRRVAPATCQHCQTGKTSWKNVSWKREELLQILLLTGVIFIKLLIK